MGRKEDHVNGQDWIASSTPLMGSMSSLLPKLSTWVVRFLITLLCWLLFKLTLVQVLDLSGFRRCGLDILPLRKWSIIADPVHARPVLSLSIKLKRLKAHLRTWKKEVFGDLFKISLKLRWGWSPQVQVPAQSWTVPVRAKSSSPWECKKTLSGVTSERRHFLATKIAHDVAERGR